MRKIILTIKSLQDCLEEEIAAQTLFFDAHSAEWQGAAQGAQTQQAIDRMHEMFHVLTEWSDELVVAPRRGRDSES